jgi:hypothetical protein
LEVTVVVTAGEEGKREEVELDPTVSKFFLAAVREPTCRQ